MSWARGLSAAAETEADVRCGNDLTRSSGSRRGALPAPGAPVLRQLVLRISVRVEASEAAARDRLQEIAIVEECRSGRAPGG